MNNNSEIIAPTPEMQDPKATPIEAEKPAVTVGGYYPDEREIILTMRAAYRKAGEPVPEYYN